MEQLQQEILHAIGWQLWEQAVSGTLYRLYEGDDRLLPPISVIICTRDRGGSLERCLQTLAQLDYPAYEVLVVDSCSQDTTVASVVQRWGFRYIREEKAGLNLARNRGIQEAQHEIIAYLDDDTLATPGWLRGIAHGFADPTVMVVTGLVLPAELETRAQSDFECYGGMSKGFTAYTIQKEALSAQELFWASRWGVGANMAFRRALFRTLGTFDLALDVGTPTRGGGDIEFLYRVVATGYALHYEPSAMIYHVHRRDQRLFRQQICNNGRSFVAYLLTIACHEPHRRMAVFWFALRHWWWGWIFRRIVQSLIKGDTWTLRMGLQELWGSCFGIRAYRTSRKRALSHLERKNKKQEVQKSSGEDTGT